MHSELHTPKGHRIVITGVAGRLGRLLAQRLHQTGDHAIVGIDRRPWPDHPPHVMHAQVDLRSKRARDILRGGDVAALVHLGVMHDLRRSGAEHHSWNIQALHRLLEAAAHNGVPKVVVLSSADVYGPRPDNPQFLTEDAPLLAAQEFPAIRDLVEIDMLAASFFWKTPQVEIVILRPVHILGGVRNAASNYLRLPVVPTLLGFDPMMQVIHELDVVEALVCALTPGVRGIFNVVGPGEVPLSTLIAELGRHHLPVPHILAAPLLGLLWRSHFSSFPVPEVDYIRYVCMVDGRRARETLGFQPRHTLQETIHAAEMVRPM